MIVTVAAESPLPPYEQIRAQIREAVESGALPPGTRLPPVRRLARDLGLAANTVARAYRELESVGVVETRGRNGTLVSAPESTTADAAQRAARAYVEAARRLGLSDRETRAHIDRALEDGP